MEDTVLFDTTTCVLVVGLGVLLFWLTTRRPSGIPPGPVPLPIIGNVLALGTNPTNKLREWRMKYGDIFSIYLGGRLAIVMNGYDTLREALVRNGETFAVRPHTYVFDELVKGKGIVATSGQVWKEQRRFALSTLKDLGLGRNVLQVKINEESEMFRRRMKAQNGHKFDFHDMLQTAVSNIICSIVFGKRFEYDDSLFLQYLHKIDENFRASGLVASLNVFPFARFIPGDPFKLERTKANINFYETNLIQPSIKTHLEEYDENNIHDFISAYIKEIKQKVVLGVQSSFDYEHLEKVIGDLFLAGTDTTATTIRWIVLYFLKYPEVQEKCAQEIQSKIGTDRMPLMSDRTNLPYTEAVISEVQRISGTVPTSGFHSVAQDTMFMGYRIPTDCIILPNIQSVMMDPGIWKNSENFFPERFLDESGKFVKREELIPFSFGKRMCPGESLARMELFLFLTAMLQHFRFQQPEDEPPPSFDAIPGAVFAPKPFKIRAFPRN